MTLPDWLGPETPAPFGDRLLAGTVGREHLLRTATLAGEAAAAAGDRERPAWLRRQESLLAAAFEEDCLYGPTARALLALWDEKGGQVPPADPAFAALVAAVARNFSVPESTAYYQRLLAGGTAGRIDAYLENECRAGRHALFWLHVALRRAVLARAFDRGEALIALALPQELAALGRELVADLALLAGNPAKALAGYASSLALAPRPTGLFRAGLAAWQAGEIDRAKGAFAALLAAMPEHVSAALALYDLATGRDRATAALPASLAIALYTCNKAEDLDRTLASLFASDLGQARVTVLDNASTDATQQVLTAWSARTGGNRLGSLRLPVNIGAPAARNWLAAEARVGRADFIAYLDDDVDLPRDWLARLFAAVAAYPEAGVWGCRVVDATNAAVAQGVDAMLVPGLGEAGAAPLPWLGDAHGETFDYGAFAHLRPCCSVMGCCHLFPRQRLLAGGGFDIRYSPSQYDDVDHDLRLVLSGHLPVYQGHLAARHRRPAPVFAPPRPDQLASGQAHRHKLLAKLGDRFGELGAIQRQAASRDLADKWREMDEAGWLSANR